MGLKHVVYYALVARVTVFTKYLNSLTSLKDDPVVTAAFSF